MAGATIRMVANKQVTLQEIHKRIHDTVGVEQISKSAQVINGVTIWMLNYEKYYFRTGSYASIAVVLTEFEEQQTAVVVASGGGEGMMNISYGANSNFAKDCALSLETCGFTVAESDIEIHSKGILKRLFNK